MFSKKDKSVVLQFCQFQKDKISKENSGNIIVEQFDVYDPFSQ